MRVQFGKWLVIATLVAFTIDVGAQQPRQPRRRPANPNGYGNTPQNNNSGYGNTVDTTQKPANNNNTGGYGTPAGNSNATDTSLPVTVIKSTSGGLLDSVKMSLRNDAAFEQNLIKDRSPLAYENIREDDAVYRVRVWREIDAREKMNLPFRYAALEDNGSQRFISIMLRAIKSGDVTAFNGDDDRFTTPITPEEAMNAFGGGFDTSKKIDRDGNVIGYEVRPKAIDPDSIYKYRIKEEWIFDKETSRIVVRILGIAPVYIKKLSTGESIGEVTPWWIYYPDLRPVLAKCEAYNPKNMGARMSWEELFESRMFTSYITKSTIDNTFDLELAQMYPNNTLFRLLEGENIKDKIFNYEQNLWAY